jgi:hypothetical protein
VSSLDRRLKGLDVFGIESVYTGMEQQSLAELRDLYLLRCEVEGKSPRTIRAYAETVGCVVGWRNVMRPIRTRSARRPAPCVGRLWLSQQASPVVLCHWASRG